jgi:hypothetical protein
MEKNTWWGYLHIEGENNIHVKRYFDRLDIEEAKVSPFVARVFGPFEATGREDAISQIQSFL